MLAEGRGGALHAQRCDGHLDRGSDHAHWTHQLVLKLDDKVVGQYLRVFE